MLQMTSEFDGYNGSPLMLMLRMEFVISKLSPYKRSTFNRCEIALYNYSVRERERERAEKKWRMSAFEMLNSKRKFASNHEMFHADAALNAYQAETGKAEMTFNQNASDF